jgi:diadenosine tetraphosphate (Ap4A) HIT family hydrolase
MAVVFATERGRAARGLQPDKINLASLGNMVPHLHWHVVPRWRDDSHFPAPIWAAAKRVVTARDNDRIA